MDEDIKICPECDAEFYSHVEVCNVCNVPLKYPGELEGEFEGDSGTGIDAESNRVPGAEGEYVCIDHGETRRLAELKGALSEVGIEAEILKEQPGVSCGGSGFGLFVPESQGLAALNAIKEYWHRVHPELADAEELLEGGRCPGCGFDLESTQPEYEDIPPEELVVNTGETLEEVQPGRLCPECGLLVG